MILRAASFGAVLAVLALSGCAGGQGVSGGVSSGAPAADAAPPLDGQAILQRTCTRCHNLNGLSVYANYWGEPEWLAMVETMIGYGAILSEEEIPVLVRYLAQNYGTAEETAAPGTTRP